MRRVQLNVQTLSTSLNMYPQYQTELHESLLDRISQQSQSDLDLLTAEFKKIDQRIVDLSRMLESSAEILQRRQIRQIGPFYGIPHQVQKSRSIDKAEREYKRAETFTIQTVSYVRKCGSNCRCDCHMQSKASTPQIFGSILGRLFCGYSGLPILNAKCNIPTCLKPQSPHLQFEYWFPLASLNSQIFQIKMSYGANTGPQLQLSTHRLVPDNAQSVTFALNGNISGLTSLFDRGLASPKDVSYTRGYSLLRKWALYGKQFETCKFLIASGADVDYRPKASSDTSPRQKAYDWILQGAVSQKDNEILRLVTAGGDFIEERNLTQLHRIVLDLSSVSLEEGLSLHPEHLNRRDAIGRTPLCWAAARGDERAVTTLLSYGADPDIMDDYYSCAVCCAADRGYTLCVRLLLEAGAKPDLRPSNGYKVGSALNCAARNASDPMVLKTLLDFGADPESSGVDGKTPLIHAARKDNASFVMLLLEYGANINATSVAGETALTVAIAFNSHNVLQLLLDRWFEYNECPRLKGPNLLQIVALYADVETVRQLHNTDHFKLKYDRNYVQSEFVRLLKERADLSDALLKAFEELLGVINAEAKPISHEPDTLSQMFRRLSGFQEDSKDRKYQDEFSDEEPFEDAVEDQTHCCLNKRGNL
ncbi:Ankyrin-1 [Arthrobotrys entomopaga]|nr:Ankyrin-1 [Arthrobotrys entomopaga]